MHAYLYQSQIQSHPRTKKKSEKNNLSQKLLFMWTLNCLLSRVIILIRHVAGNYCHPQGYETKLKQHTAKQLTLILTNPCAIAPS